MRVIGVDWGEKRIGLAAGETEVGSVRPLSSVGSSGSLRGDAQAISKVADSEMADAIVVGLPLNPLGTAQMERVCLQLVERLRDLNLLVFTVDESLTSAEAESNLKSIGMRAATRRKHVDSEAACQIVKRFFEEGSHVKELEVDPGS